MTALGAIGRMHRQVFARKQLADVSAGALVPNSGIIGGTVQDNAVPVPGALVRLYWRRTGALIDSMYCDAAGMFKFANLNPRELEGYFAVAFDPVGGINYNALISDRLTPSPDLTVPPRTISATGFLASIMGTTVVGKILQGLAFFGSSGIVLSTDKKTATLTQSGGWHSAWSNITKTTGKWYFEVTIVAQPPAMTLAIGVTSNPGNGGNAGDSGSIEYFAEGRIRQSGTYYTYGPAYTTGDVIGVAYDLDLRTVTFYKNGVSLGVAFSAGLPATVVGSMTAAGGQYAPTIHVYNNGTSDAAIMKLADTLASPPPAGFLPLA